jgi:hypothetical protein
MRERERRGRRGDERIERALPVVERWARAASTPNDPVFNN